MNNKQLQRFRRKISKVRIKYQQENRYEWLTPLLDSYQIADAGSEVEIERQLKLTGRSLACGEGCHHCCLNPTVPINEIEVMGLSWFVCEELKGETRAIVQKQLFNHQETASCPFLVNQLCTVYPVRPLACRGFHVFDKKCDLYEDVSVTRPEDIIPPYGREISWLVSKKLLPLMGVHEEVDQRKMFETGFMFRNTRSMHTFDWSVMANLMDKFPSQM